MKLSSSAILSNLPGYGTGMAIQRRYAKLSDAGFRTPLFGDASAPSILAEWTKQTEASIYHQLEVEELAKAGPYYNYPFSQWKGKVDAYFEHTFAPFDRDIENFELADEAYDFVAWVRSTTRSRTTMYTIMDTYKRSRKNTNLGFPLVTSQWTKDTVGPYLRRAQLLLEGKKVELYPYIMFKRVQPGGYDGEGENKAKQRPVWGADHAETFASLSFVYPLIDMLSSVPGFEHLLGIDILESAIQRQVATWKTSLDLSACDATFGPRLINFGLLVIAQLVDVPMSMLEQLYEYYISGAILCPDGIRVGTHGVPSGIGVTNMIETIVLKLLASQALREQGVEVSWERLLQNGDDGLFMTETPVDVGLLSSHYSKFGLVINEDKTSMSDSRFSYLQRHFYAEDGYKAVMSTVRMLNRILYSETGVNLKRIDLSPRKYWTLNTISKLENCKRSDTFDQFVDFVRRGDQFDLDVSAVLDLNPAIVEGFSVFGDDESDGIEGFDTVRVLVGGTPKGGMRVKRRTLLRS